MNRMSANRLLITWNEKIRRKLLITSLFRERNKAQRIQAKGYRPNVIGDMSP